MNKNINNDQIRTRLAPSPTGMFHIGTARTALFNFLFAKENHGKFILRFEDTDKVRSKKEYEKDILEGLKWLGLKWDDEITQNVKCKVQNNNSKLKTKDTFYRQSEHLEIYKKYTGKLLKDNKAYKKEGAIWFKISNKISKSEYQTIKFTDLIHGNIEFNINQFNDFVIIKSDGNPSFMFSNTIDDHEMGITHVIRGDDHLTNTPQQILIYQAFGWKISQFAHIPLILNSDRSKMSKRKDPVSVTRDFRDQGYLPEAMINYMALLGWNPKTPQQARGKLEREFFTLSELVKEFDLIKVNKSGAVFDIEKLNYFNNHYIRILPNNELAKLISNFQFPISKNKNKKFLLRIISVIKERMTKLSDFDQLSSFFFKLPDYKSELLVFKKSTKELSLNGLQATSYKLQATSPTKWEKIEDLNQILLDVTKEAELTNGDVFWPVRVALSGLDRSPSPPEILWVLGKEESLKRIKSAINKL